jgi:hypothetical protein
MPPAEASPTESRREIVANFVRDVTEGRIALSIQQQKWRPEDIELIGSTASKLVVYLNDYLSGIKAGEEFDYLERQLLFCITVLRTYGAFKTKIDEPKLAEEVKSLETKVDSLASQLGEMLAILKEAEAKKAARRSGGRKKKEKKLETS